MSYETILVEQRGAVTLVTLNRPKALNALNSQVLAELIQAMAAFDADASQGCAVLTGSEKAFAAGADIKEMQAQGFADMYAHNFFADWERFTATRKPIIAAVAGYALGGGCEVAMMCDFILAADTAKFGQPEIKLGVSPGMGGSQRLTRAVGKAKAMEMCLTGRMMDAQEAERAGLVSRILPAADLVEEAVKTAAEIAAMPPLAILANKEMVNTAFETTLAQGISFERRLFHGLFGTADQKEGMTAFVEKRPGNWTGKVIAAAAFLLLAAQTGPFTVVETGKSYAHLDQAVTEIRDDTATIMIAPGTYRDCTVQTGGKITFKAAKPGTVIFDGEICEGKAAFVLRGRGSVVDGIVFRGMRVDDGNGAGIRIEMGDLTVTNAMFLDSQEGILGGGHETVRNITIDRSTFAGLGQCDETVDCSHSIYLGLNGQVTVTRSRFERGTGGHYVKIRAPRVTITDNSFDDSKGRKTNYMIDLSEGGTGLIARNTFVQGKGKENHSGLIVVAAEGRTYPAAGLRVEDNDASLAPGAPSDPAFVADLSGDTIALANNRLGPGIRAFERRR